MNITVLRACAAAIAAVACVSICGGALAGEAKPNIVYVVAESRLTYSSMAFVSTLLTKKV